LAALDSALTLDPKYAPALANRGMIYAALGDDGQAMSDYQSALALEPNNELAIFGVSKLQGRQ
jgi:Tfp pilus assembly protein PilF